MGNSPKVYEVWRKSASLSREDVSTWQLYVGASNISGVVETDKLYEPLIRRHLGWTITFGYGYWDGRQESSVIVTIVCSEVVARRTARDIACELNQESVGLVRAGDAMEFVS